LPCQATGYLLASPHHTTRTPLTTLRPHPPSPVHGYVPPVAAPPSTAASLQDPDASTPGPELPARVSARPAAGRGRGGRAGSRARGGGGRGRAAERGGGGATPAARAATSLLRASEGARARPRKGAPRPSGRLVRTAAHGAARMARAACGQLPGASGVVAAAAAGAVGADEADEGEHEGEGEEDWDEAARREEDAAQAAILGARQAAEAVASRHEEVTRARPTARGHGRRGIRRRGTGRWGIGRRGIGRRGTGRWGGCRSAPWLTPALLPPTARWRARSARRYARSRTTRACGPTRCLPRRTCCPLTCRRGRPTRPVRLSAEAVVTSGCAPPATACRTAAAYPILPRAAASTATAAARTAMAAA
jgi:hypothetical protein